MNLNMRTLLFVVSFLIANVIADDYPTIALAASQIAPMQKMVEAIGNGELQLVGGSKILCLLSVLLLLLLLLVGNGVIFGVGDTSWYNPSTDGCTVLDCVSSSCKVCRDAGTCGANHLDLEYRYCGPTTDQTAYGNPYINASHAVCCDADGFVTAMCVACLCFLFVVVFFLFRFSFSFIF
jgi:hypothetical protein